jgi:Glycosyl transferase family 2
LLLVRDQEAFFSIVISGNHWDHILHTLNTVLDNAGEYLLEVILVSSIRVPGELIPGLSNLKVLILENADIFRLRLDAIKCCRGKWIVLLEDHNEIKAGWFESLFSHIHANPAALAFVTSLKNGSQDASIDEANFLFNFAAYLPEAWNLLVDRHPVIAGACFNKSVLNDYETINEGELELKILPGLYLEKKTIFIQDSSIIHIQSNSLLHTLMNHFHNAKACAGLLKEMNHNQIDREALRRSIKVPLFFYRKWTRAPYRMILDSGYQRCKPYLILIGIVYGMGSTLGWIFGKGKSASSLE